MAEDPEKLKEKLERDKMIRSDEFNKIGEFQAPTRVATSRQETIKKR